ncbi:MAG: hypothetical protein FWH15_06580 [Betaproteobacteria bacterium]|nr:hypothetical protein [Betaproteobacteria bacterium]
MLFKALPAFDLSPYALSLYALFLGMCAQTFALALTLRQCLGKRNRNTWIALALAMLFLLRQRWAALEFSLATGVYDSFSAFCDLLASLLLCLAIIGFIRAECG